jgi:sugar lactone lactonase YvrE
MTMTRLLLVLVAAATVTVSLAGAAGAAFPSRIDLPDGWQPEGIATASGKFYAGSIPTGAIFRGSLRTGKGSVLVQAQADRAALGLKVDRGRIFVAGGPTGMAFVYNARTGANITSFGLSSGGSFVNDVVVTKRAAWFTDSFKPVLYRVPLGPGGAPGPQSGVTAVDLSGDYVHQGGGAFNLNGIDATANGNVLIAVQTATGKLFRISPSGRTREIVLAKDESVPNGDGILLRGRTLFVVQNQANVVARIALASSLRSGTVVTRLDDPGLDVPTTIAKHGSRLYAVNARFNTPPTATTEYWITQLTK